MSKENLRRELLLARRAITDDEYSEKNRIIAGKFMEAVDLSKVRKLHSYRSVAAWREPDTSIIVDRVRLERPKIAIEYASLDKDAPIPEDKYGLIIVPVLGFDGNNHRLGLGGGWYDRFLAAQPQALKIGLCFRSGSIENLPREPHDIPLDRVITEV